MSRIPTALARVPVGRANLPERYETAKRALAECTRIDECKDWSDKAQALASYARQAQDDTLQKHAMRIRARAIRRAGELLKTFDARGAHMKNGGTPVSRTDAAAGAGMSSDQRTQAVRVANVPEDDFESAVESANPPTVTKLADAGKRQRTDPFLSQPKPDGFAEATAALGSLREFAKFCMDHDADRVAHGVLPHEIENARAWVSTVDRWLDRFVVNLEEADVLAR